MKRLLLVFFLIGSLAALSAQSITGVITGTVFDEAAAVIPGAEVVAINMDTQVRQTTTTGEAGGYLIPALRPGRYRVTCENPGFKRLVREPIVVDTNRTVTLDLTLSVGDTATEVTVTADAPLVQESTAVIQYGVNQRAIEELPLPDQSVLHVLTLMPGVIGEVARSLPPSPPAM